MKHKCNSQCYADLIRYGTEERPGCNMWDAEDAARREWDASPDGIIAAAGIWH